VGTFRQVSPGFILIAASSVIIIQRQPLHLHLHRKQIVVHYQFIDIVDNNFTANIINQVYIHIDRKQIIITARISPSSSESIVLIIFNADFPVLGEHL
jgi:hypothetical protein